MVIRTKLIVVVVLAVVLAVLLLLPPANSDGINAGDVLPETESTVIKEDIVGSGLPVATSEWYFVLLTDLTGENASAGVAAAWGFDYGIKSLNEAGGPRGVIVRSAVRDTASVLERAAAEMSTVVESSDATPEVLLVFGPVVPEQYDVAALSFVEAQIPTIGSSFSEKTLQDFAPYAVSGESAPGALAGKAVSAWLNKNKKIEKVTIINDSSFECLQSNAESAKSLILESEREVLATVTANGDTFNAASVAEEAYKTGADAYYIDLPGDGNKRVAEQLVHLNGDVAPSMLLGTYNADVSQMLSVEAFNTDKVSVWSEFDLASDVAGRQAFKEAFDDAIGNSSYYGIAVAYCQAAQFTKQAIEDLELTGAPERLKEEREQLTKYLRNCSLVDSPLGDYSMVEGEKIIPSLLYHIKSGKFAPIRQ